MQNLGRHFGRLSLVLLLAASLAGCRDYTLRDAGNSLEEKTYADRDLKLSAADYNKILAPNAPVAKSKRGGAPDLMPVVADEQRNILPQPLVSVTVNQDVPLRDVFYELAKQAQVDIEMDPDITGSVIFTAYNRPFDQVVQRLSELSGLRYKYVDGVLRVERDLPYMKIYRVDYSGLTRQFDSQIQSSTGVDASAIGASGGSSGQNGSKSTIATKTVSDFWKELEGNMTQILQIGRFQQKKDNKSAAPLTTPNAIPAVTTEQLAGTGAPAAAAQPAAPVPQAAPVAAGQEKEEELKGDSQNDPYYSVNRQAGLISVFASDVQHKKVAEYLAQLRKSMNTQVLIEAKVLEVSLSNEYILGINWNQFLAGDLVLNANLANPNFIQDQVALNAGTSGNIFNIGIQGDDISVLLNALSRYGTTRALSSPRITVMNNQSALLNVSENQVFFDLDITVTPSTIGGPGQTTINSQIRSVPVGLIVNVHPTVDMETNEITMNLRPSITRIAGQVEDPAIAFLSGAPAGATNNIPILAVRELDSVVQMRSGETIIMGGLMQDSNESVNTGVPVVSEIPVVGALFRGTQDRTRKTELVILLKATAVTPKPGKVDKELYNKLGADRRPLDIN